MPEAATALYQGCFLCKSSFLPHAQSAKKQAEAYYIDSHLKTGKGPVFKMSVLPRPALIVGVWTAGSASLDLHMEAVSGVCLVASTNEQGSIINFIFKCSCQLLGCHLHLTMVKALRSMHI